MLTQPDAEIGVGSRHRKGRDMRPMMPDPREGTHNAHVRFTTPDFADTDDMSVKASVDPNNYAHNLFTHLPPC
jgi:hypothetical protein